ncbi:UPF0029-domain-containing protein [Pseudovirgaria hyperparasitica]|uniref:UPF0029-domain-containing protein n=1 Tax=Pseudovirgaria hyperparasitica TaxID=470096 RepID=A0A6A6VYJ8_9PEZI|nr:UPF0029-domain-containing protein [Pseudovirgaria hyperparasitica]KAF2754740.1 UPF0029-domain-containing protein [Pseudovirgaria hyperparasitica]
MSSLADELLSINSIYGENTLELESAALSDPNNAPSICILRLPTPPSITLRLEFPPNYPDAPPSILGTQSVGHDIRKGFGNEVVNVVRDTLAKVYEPGAPCIFDLLEDVGEAIAQQEERRPEQHLEEHNVGDEDNEEGQTTKKDCFTQQPSSMLDHEPLWTLSDPINEKKSLFLAWVAPVSSTAQAHAYVSHLVSTDKKVAKATHNITAWRIEGGNGAVFQDCDDDGETAAGGRLLHLLQIMDVWNVMVVVSRWYGGIKLGPDRFRLINQVARNGLLKAGFVKEEKEAGSKKGKK